MGKGQQIAQNGIEAVALFGYDFQESARILRIVDGAVQQRFYKTFDGSDGRTQFMGYIGDKITAHLFEAA